MNMNTAESLWHQIKEKEYMESIRERTWDHAQCVPSTEEELSCPELKRITYYPASHRKILHIKQSPFSRTFYLQRIMIGFKFFFSFCA